MGELVHGRFPNHRQTEFSDDPTSVAVPKFFEGTPFIDPHRERIPMASNTNGFSIAQLFHGYDEDRAKRDLEFIDEHRSFLDQVCARADAIRKRVFIDLGVNDDELVCIEDRRSAFMALPIEEVSRFILLSKSDAWYHLKLHYGALVVEFIGRLHQAGAYASNRS